MVALLRAQLGTGATPAAQRLAECDWARLEFLAAHHGVAPILYCALRDHAESVPAEWLRRMKLQYIANALRNALAQSQVNEIAAVLDEQRIPVVVMKGAALMRTLYEDPGLRRLSDVDVLVEACDVERAGAQLQHIGFDPVAAEHERRRGPLCHIHRTYERPQPQSIPVELHWRLFEGYQPYVFDLAAVRAAARHLPDMPDNVFVMSPEHELAHLCVHLERHAVAYRSLVARDDWFELLLLPQGLGRLLWLYDIAKSVQRGATRIDWDDFVATARRWAIDGHLYAVLELCRRALGVSPPAEVLRALDRGGPRLVERLAHRIVFAAHRASEARQPAWATQASSHVLRATHTWTSVFPPTGYLRARYPTARSALVRRARHLREIAPELWAETLGRLRHALTPGKDVAG